MRYLAGITLLSASFLLSQLAHAQSDAEVAFQQAKTAYAGEEFAKARDLLITASQTDDRNPDVFLLLGKSHYQLGNVADAMAAWRQTLKLAPKHAYAQKMLQTLQSQLTDVEVRIQVVQSLLREHLIAEAQAEIRSLRGTQSLEAGQLHRVLLLEAEALVRAGQGASALRAIEELSIRDPAQAKSAQVLLLKGTANTSLGGDEAAEGLAILQAVVTDFADTPQAADAELELLSFRISQGETAVDELAAWIAKHGQHTSARRARAKMVEAVAIFFAAAAQLPAPEEDAALSTPDKTALSAARQAFDMFVLARDAKNLTTQIVVHLQTRYVKNGAFDAADAAIQELLKMKLPGSSKVLAEQARTRVLDLAAGAELADILFVLQQGATDLEPLATWITTHPKHSGVANARRQLLSAHLAATRRAGTPRRDAALSASDRAALAVAVVILEKTKEAADVLKLVKELSTHFQSHYASHQAFAAAIIGAQELVKLELPRSSRLQALNDLAGVQITSAMAKLTADAQAGRLTAGPLPAGLVEALKTMKTINDEFPSTSAWPRQAALAVQIHAQSGYIAWPARVTQLKPTQAWALEIALPAVSASKLAEPVQTITNIVGELAVLKQPSARGLAASVHAQLLNAIAEDNALWPDQVLKQVDLLAADAEAVFQENIQQGQADKNTQLTETQKRLLALVSKLVVTRPSAAPQALARLEKHLTLWNQHDRDAAVEQAYALLEKDLPPSQKREVRLAVARMWYNRAIENHDRLLQRGFQPARELDPLLEKTLVRCYELYAGLDETHEFVERVRALRDGVIEHYKQLEYFDIAEAAIKVKADPAVATVDAYAEFQLAGLRLTIAKRELHQLLRQHQGRQQIALTPAFKEAIAAYTKFVADHPGHRLVGSAIGQVFEVGRLFERNQAYAIAAEVYSGLETFAADQESLANVGPGETPVADRAALAVATALHIKAARDLTESRKQLAADAAAPTEMSDEYAAAIKAYQHVVATYPDGPLVSAAIGKVMSVGLEYAAIDAWEVASGVYTSLEAQKLPLRRPQRLQLARALCELGKVLPEYARQVLAAITLWERAAPAGGGEMISQLAGGTGLGGGAFDDFRPGNEPFGGAPAQPAPVEKPSVPIDPTAAAGGLPAPDMSEFRADLDRARREADLLAAVQAQQSQLATRIAALRDTTIRNVTVQTDNQVTNATHSAAGTVLSDAEIARQQATLDVAYAALQAIRKEHPHTTTADQARGEIMAIVNHWRGIRQWERAAQLVKRYLADNPRDAALPQLRHEIARDYLAWAASGVKAGTPKQEVLEEVAKRFKLARAELTGIIAAFADEQTLKHQAQWDIANSYLSQARVIAGFSNTLARGQFVRAANELLQTVELYHDHPQVGQIPQMLWQISQELVSRGYFDEAITVWNEMTLHYPGDALAEQAAMSIAQTYQHQLGQPLRAVESYLELNFARGGNQVALQDTILQIAAQLNGEKRWVEALHILETFVDSFPQHPQAGHALTMIGQVHQTNEVWEDAIEAYRRVILEYDTGQWAQQAKWSIAECTINLSRWDEASGAYREFQKAYPKDARVAQATARLEILKDLARYQKVVDEKGQRKAFDAQYQIGMIVRSKLANPVKAIIEYRKVQTNWPESHLADDALFQVGMIYLELGETEKARGAFLLAAKEYPSSPLADDALFQVGASYENEAQQLVGVTRGTSVAMANDLAQKQAYQLSQMNRRVQRGKSLDQITQLKNEGKGDEAEHRLAFNTAQNIAFDYANAEVIANWAEQQAEVLTTAQLADRQDKINAALREAVASFRRAASVASADKADDALLRMAQIYDQRLKDADSAMATWLEIVEQYSGTTVAEDASWKIAQYYEQHDRHAKAIDAYQSFLRNYRRSPKAGTAQALIAENHEHLGQWVDAMDAYTNYITNYPQGPLAAKAKEQISWIKTYRL